MLLKLMIEALTWRDFWALSIGGAIGCRVLLSISRAVSAIFPSSAPCPGKYLWYEFRPAGGSLLPLECSRSEFISYRDGSR